MTEGPSAGATPPGVAADPSAEGSAAVAARPGSHRAKRSPYSVIVPLVVVAVAVVSVGVGIYGWLTVSSAPQTLPPVIPAASEATQTPTPTPTPTPSPSKTASPKPSASSSPVSTPKPTPKPSKTVTPVARTTPVVVLNQTSITGLAASTAATLERKGWDVVAVGNWRGDVSETTVYYPAGKAAQAEQLAKDLGVDRVRPRASGMRSDRLTVILNSRPG